MTIDPDKLRALHEAARLGLSWMQALSNGPAAIGVDPVPEHIQRMAKADLPKFQAVVDAALPAIDERAALTARVEALERALKPFAEFADPRKAFPAGMPITSGSNMAKKQLTMGDCYTAAEALENSK